MVPNSRGGLYRACITVASGRITEVTPHHGGRGPANEDLDFVPHVAVPGFIDLQVNGAFGYDITSDPSTMWPIGERLLAHGVTAFLPTVITSPPQPRRAAYAAIRNRPARYAGAAALGLHIEGPALSPEGAGTHPLADLVDDADVLAEELIAHADAVALVTLAPEAQNAVQAVERLVRAQIAVSLGHTAATAAVTREALRAGASAFTHLFNAMGPLHHREVGAAGAALLHPEARVSLIADGHHLADDAIRLAWRLAGPRRICLITDAMAGTGAPAGTYRIGDISVKCAQTARNDGDNLAGSLLTMPEAARRTRDITGATWDELAAITSGNQADLLGDADRGRIMPGRLADLAIVDSQLRPVATIVAGALAWRRRDTATSASPRTNPRDDATDAGPAAGNHSAKSAADGTSGMCDRTAATTRSPTAATIGVDIGGTTFKAAVFDGAALGPVRRGATGSDRPATEVLAAIRQAIDDLADAARGAVVRGVGIACAGIVDAAAGTVIRAASLNWSDVDVIAGLGPDLGLPVAVEHDVFLAALAEWETGAGIEAESMLYVSVGTSVASRLFTQHGTERGNANLAGEMGFMPVGDGARRLESVASARAMSDAYYRQTGRPATVAQIIATATNDPSAARVWSDAMDALAQGVAAAVCLQDPEIVVVGGGVSNAGQELLDALNSRLAARLAPLREPPPTVIATHGADSGIIGAALHGLPLWVPETVSSVVRRHFGTR